MDVSSSLWFTSLLTRSALAFPCKGIETLLVWSALLHWPKRSKTLLNSAALVCVVEAPCRQEAGKSVFKSVCLLKCAWRKKRLDSAEPENIARHMVRLYEDSPGRDFCLLTFAAFVLLGGAEPRRALIVQLYAKRPTCVHNKVPCSKLATVLGACFLFFSFFFLFLHASIIWC